MANTACNKKRLLPNRLLQQAGNSRFSFYPAHSIADFVRNYKPPFCDF